MRPGKWQPRYVEDVLVAQAMCVLAAAGLRLDMAAALARRWADGEDPLYAGDGVVLHLTLPPLDLSEWLPSG
jgi:hypothetical protein